MLSCIDIIGCQHKYLLRPMRYTHSCYTLAWYNVKLKHKLCWEHVGGFISMTSGFDTFPSPPDSHEMLDLHDPLPVAGLLAIPHAHVYR